MCFPEYQNQDFYELIFINDGSTDLKTLRILNSIKSKGISVINQKNQGVCIARNYGIELAKGEYILPLDGDDLINPDFFFDAVNILDDNPEYSVVYCDGEFFGDKTGNWTIGDFSLQKLMIWNYLHVSAVFRKSSWKMINGYDPKSNGLEDWDLWLGMAFSGAKFYYLQKKYFKYRINQSSASHNISKHKYDELLGYLDRKYKNYINRDYISERMILNIKNNKKLLIKVLIAVYFPNFIKKLINKGIVNKDSVFY